MAANKHDLLLLFDRPKEPVNRAKGEKQAVFDVPSNLLPDRFKDTSIELANRFGEEVKERIPVSDISPPDLSVALQLSRYENFSLFIPKHRAIAGSLINIFMSAKSVGELQSTAIYARERVNPYLFQYALSVAMLHRDDTKDLDVPSLVSSFPDKFVDGTVIGKAREEANLIPQGSRMPIIIPRDYTASDLEPEHRIAYWREDIGLNLHHWHWHLVYPFNGPENIVRKDRRGELFFYMHQQIQARYNMERFSNSLARVRRLTDWKGVIEEGYFPKLNSLVASRGWGGRSSNMQIQGINREIDQIRVDIDTFLRWRDRIYEAIHSGTVMGGNNQKITLTEFGGIDVLGDIVEASILTPNRNYYGDLHNIGHVFLSMVNDPDGRHLESFTPIADPAMAMRDPAFYRLHEFVDDIFQEFKATLPAYTNPQLNYRNVTVTGVQVDVEGGQPNMLETFWQESDVNLSRGLDFTPRGPIFVRFTHLQHKPFTYRINVNNTTGKQTQGTCRIFLGPKRDERGLPWLFRDQRNLLIELDRFVVTLANGQNTISRRSTDSSLTIPFERTFRDVDTNRPAGGDALEAFNFCGCGWPQHLLIPRGTPQGYQCELFVMISNYEDDRIDQPPGEACSDASSFCGIKDRKYPDKRSMGFPFDRPARAGVDTFQQFLMPNMALIDVTIRLTDSVLARRQ